MGRSPALRRSYFRGLAHQAGRFASVGTAATAVHVTLFAVLIEVFQSAPVVANVAAFGVALLLSFAGHCRWTFGHRGRRWPAFGRFTVVAGLGLGLNSIIAYGIADRLGWHYGYAMVLMVTVTPAVLFLLSSRWAFVERESARALPPCEVEQPPARQPVRAQQDPTLQRKYDAEQGVQRGHPTGARMGGEDLGRANTSRSPAALS